MVLDCIATFSATLYSFPSELLRVICTGTEAAFHSCVFSLARPEGH